jgi:hypothetical protein
VFADCGIEGLVSEDKSRDLVSHEPSNDGGIRRIPTNDAVPPEGLPSRATA